MRLYTKGLAAFAVVIVIAVVVVALLVGGRTQTEFRQYSVLNSSRAQNLAVWLSNYYEQNGSWDQVQANLQAHESGRRGSGQGVSAGQWDYLVIDVNHVIVGDSAVADLGAAVTMTERDVALPIYVHENVVGYLLPSEQAMQASALDVPAQQFLEEVRSALLIGSLVAILGAMAMAVVLMRGIVNPVRALTRAAEQVAQGDLDARAPVSGKDEIATLSHTFNDMAVSLQRAEQARQSQTADIAHELRNPLSVLQGTLEAIADQIYDPTPENLQPALDQAHTLNRLVADLRTLALADAGQLHLNTVPMDLKALVSRISEVYRDQLNHKGLSLTVDIPANLPPIQGDSERITQVLNNLFSNALRYVPAGCEIHIVLHAKDQGIALDFIDNGPGITAQEIPHLFERFWRAEPSRSRVTGGSGLGLSIAQRIIEAHGGHISAAQTPGSGLTLHVWLPVS